MMNTTRRNNVSRYINIKEADAKLSENVYTFNLYIDNSEALKTRIIKQININKKTKANENSLLRGKIVINNN
jgi:hypothetical protein